MLAGNLLGVQMAEVPFRADIWGTVSDWIIVLVTAIGTLYIVLSFDEQGKINKQQTELNRLAMEKDRREIRPYFKIESEKLMPYADLYEVHIALENAPAQSVEITYSTTTDYIANPDISFREEWEVGNKLYLRLSSNKDIGSTKAYIGIVDMKFKDEDGRCYMQNINFNGRRFDTTFPKLTKEYTILDA